MNEIMDQGAGSAPASMLPDFSILAGAARVRQLVEAGGPVVLILIAMSVIALSIVIVKWWQLRGVDAGNRRPVREALALYRAGRRCEAVERIGRSRNPAAKVLLDIERGQRRQVPVATLRDAAYHHASDVVETLRGHLKALEVIAALAPLIGLFGTVVGMIEAFQQLEAAGSQVNPSVLSGGIWEALLTTAAGLSVAIPAIAALNWLERRVDRLAHEMDHVIVGALTEDITGSDGDAREQPLLEHGANAA